MGMVYRKKKGKAGFTMVEMLVVVGIIAVLSGALIAGMDRMRKTAQKAKVQETVSNTATALGAIFQKEMAWPQMLIRYNNRQLEAEPSHVFVRHGLLGLSYDSSSYAPNDRSKRIIRLTGADRCGIVDPWAAATLKRQRVSSAEKEGLTLKVDTGGTVQDHILWYAIDYDGDGITEANVNGTEIKVRAPACVWSAGADGVLGEYGKHSKAGADDVYSWARSQEVK